MKNIAQGQPVNALAQGDDPGNPWEPLGILAVNGGCEATQLEGGKMFV